MQNCGRSGSVGGIIDWLELRWMNRTRTSRKWASKNAARSQQVDRLTENKGFSFFPLTTGKYCTTLFLQVSFAADKWIDGKRSSRCPGQRIMPVIANFHRSESVFV